MKLKFTVIAILIASFMLFSVPVIAQTSSEARIVYSYMVLHGKKPDNSDLNKWKARNFRNLGEAFNEIKAELNASSNYDESKAYAKKIMIMKCYRDALAYNPSIDEVKYWLTRTDSYSSLFDNHMNYANNIYDAVINNAHRNTMYRDATPQERAYWKEKSKTGKIPAYLIEGYIKSRQQKGGGYKLQGLFDPIGNLFASFVNFFIVPAEVRAEAVQIGMPPANMAGNLDETMARLVAAGGGNLIGPDGASLVAAGAGNLVAAGAGN